MYKRKIPIELNCGLDLVKEVIYGKWKIHLIHFIAEGNKRPNELQKKIPRATRRVLNVQLNELETHRFISKKIYAELPPKVEYSLTDLGRSLLPIITALGKWGDDNQEHLRQVIANSHDIANKSLASFEDASKAVFALNLTRTTKMKN